MAIEYDPLSVRTLAREIRERFAGRCVDSAWLDGDRRRGGLRFEGGDQLLFLLHPTLGHVLAGGDLPRLPAPESRSFRKAEILDARAPADERLLYLDLGSPPHAPNWRLVAELHTNQWNLLLLDLPEAEIGAVAWPREPGGRVLRTGARYEPLESDREGRDGGIGEARWRELVAGAPDGGLRDHVLRNVAWTSGASVEWVLAPLRAAGEGAAVEGEGSDGGEEGGGEDEGPAPSADPAGRAYLRYRSLLEAAGVADAGDGEAPAWLLPREGEAGPLPYVARLGRRDARRAGSLLGAMEAAARERGVLEALRSESPLSGDESGEGDAGAPGPPVGEPDPELVELLEALEEKAEALDRRKESLRRELEEGEDPEALRSVGHLILARKDRIARGAGRTELEGFDGEPVEVELDPALGAAENARKYYDRASRRERARQRVPEEIRKVEGRRERLAAAREEIREALESGEPPGDERVDELWALAGGRPGEGGGPEDGEGDRPPYRVLRTAGGLEVRVGRSAMDNEELTFHHSAPDDVWLHARQVPGSHVILRWGHRDGNPPRKDLLEAAVAAATNSQARHSGTVGVDWTRRKYVRSPRKSPPGAVVPERVKTVFVKPDEKVVKRMAAREEARGG